MAEATDRGASHDVDINDKQASKDWQSRKSHYPSLDVLIQPREYLLLRLPPTFHVPASVQQLLLKPADSEDGEPSFCTVSRTHRELSILISTPSSGTIGELKGELQLPAGKGEEDGYGVDGPWRTFRIRGPMQFHLVGVLLEFSKCLAQRSISLFAVSTWDTDYICVKGEDFQNACTPLREDGWNVVDKAD